MERAGVSPVGPALLPRPMICPWPIPVNRVLPICVNCVILQPIMSEHARKFLLFLGISLLFRGFYLYLFYDRYSYDLANWNRMSEVLQRGVNPYHQDEVIVNFPPVWLVCLFWFKKISLCLHCTLNDVVRTFLIVIESILSALLYAALLRFVKSTNAAKILIIGIAINPICIFQVCQHCNFDVLVALSLFLAVWLLLRFQEQPEARLWLWACFALGLGAVAKLIPLSLAPLLLLSLRKLKLAEQLLGAALLLAPLGLALSILYMLTPADIETRILGYRSLAGAFGFTGVFNLLDMPRLLTVWPRVFEIVYGAGWVSLGAWLLTREKLDPRQLVSLAAALLLAIPALGPGYGLQYIYWFLPLLVLLYEWTDRKTRAFLLVLYAVATLTYTIAYALNYTAYGAFLLDLTRNETLLRWGEIITTQKGEALLCLPLWIFYLLATVVFAAPTGREILRDLRQGWRRHPRLDP